MKTVAGSIYVLLLVSTLLFSCESDDQTRGMDRPNIVLILADDLGYGDFSSYGAQLIHTPNVDRLAREGVRFTNAHSPSSLCSPTRYSLLTGRYSWRSRLKSGVLGFFSPLLIEEGRETIASFLKKEGYATACIGKWHLGFGDQYPIVWSKPLTPGPLDVGFDTFYGIAVGSNSLPRRYVSGSVRTDEITVVNEIGRHLTEKAVDFIDQQGTEPFFLYFSTVAVHFPIEPDDEFIDTSEAGRYGDFVQEFDWSVGEVVKALEAKGLTDNTLIIVTSDNGGASYSACDTTHSPNGDLKGEKGLLAEGGHRVPLIAKWPWRIEKGIETDSLFSLVDLFSTISSLFDTALSRETAPDSVNRWYSFTGNPPPDLEVTVHHSGHGKFGITANDWKYIPEQEPLPSTEFLPPPTRLEPQCILQDFDNFAEVPQLYNLKNDLFETENVIAMYPEIAEELDTLLRKEQTEEFGEDI